MLILTYLSLSLICLTKKKTKKKHEQLNNKPQKHSFVSEKLFIYCSPDQPQDAPLYDPARRFEPAALFLCPFLSLALKA